MAIDTSFWYLISFLIFIGSLAKPVKNILLKAFKDKSAEIAKDLLEAERMKAEAISLLSDAKKRQIEAQQDAENILHHAEKESKRIREDSTRELSDFITKQKLALENRLKQLELNAVQDIHDHMIKVAVETAHDVIQKKLTEAEDQAFTAHEFKKVKHLP